MLYLQQPTTCPYPVPDLSSPCHFLKIHFNIILQSMPRSSNWPRSLRFLHQNPACCFPLSCTCHMPCPSLSSWFHHPNNIWWGVQIIKKTKLNYVLMVFIVSPWIFIYLLVFTNVRTFMWVKYYTNSHLCNTVHSYMFQSQRIIIREPNFPC